MELNSYKIMQNRFKTTKIKKESQADRYGDELERV